MHPFNGRQPAPVRSGAIDCRLPVHDLDVTAFPRSAAEADALIRHNRAVEAGCAGPPAGHLDAVTQARDLDAVRAALGEERASFFFYGYTGPGQAYAHLCPHRVRAMAMDSPLEHSVPVVVRAAAYASTVEREFTRFVAWCTGSVRCTDRTSPRSTTPCCAMPTGVRSGWTCRPNRAAPNRSRRRSRCAATTWRSSPGNCWRSAT